MTDDVFEPAANLVVVDDCWNRIGIQGDRSCPRLAEVVTCHNCPVFAEAGARLFERPPPAEYVREWAGQLARADEAEAGDSLSLVVFRVGAEWLALDVAVLVEVAEPRRVHRIPHRSGRLLMGLVNIRGELHPCVSLRNLLGIEAAGDCPNWLLVAQGPAGAWVFAVDEVAGLERVETRAVLPAPATVAHNLRRAAQGVFEQNGRQVGLLDQARVFEALNTVTG